MEKGRIIGRGARAEVYALPDGRALKLYNAGVSPEAVAREARIGMAVHAAGVPSPAVYETVNEDDRVGIIFELLTGGELSGRLLADPSAASTVGALLAELHAGMHALTLPEIPKADWSGAVAWMKKVPLPDDLPDADGLRAAAGARMAALPTGDRLCHCDFHLGNVIDSQRGPVVIDWPDARLANPDMDVARTVMILTTGAAFVPPTVAPRELVTAILADVKAAYLRRYRELRPISDETLRAWLLPLVVSRFSEQLPQEHYILKPLLLSLRD